MARLTAVFLLVTLLWPVIPVRSGGDEAGTGSGAPRFTEVVVVGDGGAPLDRTSDQRSCRNRPRSRAALCVSGGLLREPRTRTVARVTRPRVHIPPSPLIVVERHQRTVVAGERGRAAGRASWFCGAGSRCTRGYPGGLYAAAGPPLRVGDWRGRFVNVSANGRVVRVRLIDWCACPQRVLDLYRDSFSRLADPSVGLVKVVVTW